MKILLSEKQKGIVSIIAAVVINLVLGSFYLWGSINIYVASYYKINYDPELQTDITSMCFPIMAVACNGVVPISLKICEKLGIRLHCFIFSVFFSVCVFVSSYMTSFWYFVLLYGVGFGFGSGMIYLIPLYNCYKFFPNKRGLISGIIMGGYGVGSLISSNIFLTLVNPDNKKPGEDHYFSAEIANNVPKSLRIIAIFFFGLMVIGIIFLFEFPMTPEELEKENEEENQQSKIIEKVEEEEEEEPAKIVLKLVEEPSYEKQDNNQIKSINADLKEKLISSHGKKISIKNSNDGLFIPKKASMFHSSIAKWSPRTINPKDDKECPDLYHALKSLPFYIIFLMLFFSAQNGYFLAANFKNYGILKPDLNDDVFLTLVGSLSSIFNGGGRLLWGYILDKFGFKKVYTFLLIFQLVLTGTIQSVSEIKSTYLIWVCMALFCEGGHFVIFTPLCMRVFGTKVGAAVYSLMMIGFCCSNLCQYGITLIGKAGGLRYDDEFWIFFGFSALPLVALYTLKLEYKHKEK